jgi:hypothetical protein
VGKKNGEHYSPNRFSSCSCLFDLLVFLFELGLLVVDFLCVVIFYYFFQFFYCLIN